MNNVAQLFPDDTPKVEPVASRFEEAWKAYPYPRRLDKAKCRAIFEAITSPNGYRTKTKVPDSGGYVEVHHRASADDVIRAIEKYAETHKQSGSGAFGYRENGKYIKHFATFLNSGAFEDFI